MNWRDAIAYLLNRLRLDDMQSRLLFSSALLVFTPLLLLLPLQERTSSPISDPSVYRELQYITDIQNANVQRWFTEQSSFVELLSNLPSVRQGTSADIQLVLDETFRVQSNFTALTFIDASGIARASVNGPLNLYLGDRDYFQQAKQGKVTLSNVLVDRSTGRPVLVFASPVHGEDGTIRGVITSTTQLSRLQNILTSVHFGTTGKMYIAAPDGTVIAGAALDMPSSLIRRLDGFKQAQHSQQGIGTYTDYLGQNVVAVFKPLEIHDWILFCEMDIKEAYQHHENKLRLLLIGLGLVTILALLLLFLGQEMFLRPLRHLMHLAEEYRKGNYMARLSKQNLLLAPTELRHLGETLNANAEKLSTMLETMDIVNKVVTETEARYRTLVEKSMVGVYGILDNRIMYANPRLAELLGYELGELSGGMPVHDIIHPDHLLEVQQRMKDRLAGELVDENYEVKLIRRDGQVIFAEIYASLGTLGGQPALIGTILDISERKKMEDELRHLSMHDQLTGLFNRTFFEGEMQRLSSSRHPIGIVIIDVNGLKLINDTLGHASGDALICNVASLLRLHFRGDDIVSRIGGDEFAALLPNSTDQQLGNLLKRLRTAASAYNQEHPELPLSIATGYAIATPEITSLEDAFRQADNHMYNDKSQHRESARRLILNSFLRKVQGREGTQQKDIQHMQMLITKLAQKLQLPDTLIPQLQAAVRYYDIGLLSVSESILSSKASLSEEDRRHIRRHPEVGQHLVESIPELSGIGDWILKHHERWDGSGYPMGLSGANIPIGVRMLSLIDSYEAMRHDRPYRPALSFEETIAELKSQAGRQFDPQITESFITLLYELHEKQVEATAKTK
ncbi:HD domain-containing phosphohydrolase [Anaeromusa sp.]|uniref:diguanylate cyclase domain-containing protein n=1 Tax=Anaeromusa sp. TaxID=1872520 RepID=UPI00260A6CF5|nr:HD domain-containing phosphohydrolase [Anaeromusa sp.]MDD3159098.1 diguanylate cyclase [Anaeromusa sp.]